MALYRLGEDAPQLGADAWVADNASVIGRVRLGAAPASGTAPCCAATTSWITVGARSNVQDGSVLHTDPGIAADRWATT